ncbi:MAG TPA: hypothetical protein VJM33_08170, partial [Microthrixaceae bacterium]|nr:hypothetical protein [Microthrixaceae bacterium]
LVARTAAALTELYDAFKPLVIAQHPTNPFVGLTNQNRFGFLDTTPATTAQVRFLQHYWDLFDDLIAAYDDLRWAGVDLLCACCPPEGLFPRHLMAGVLDPDQFDPADYRHRFVPSPAVGDCEERSAEVKALFERLVSMLDKFTDTPPDDAIRATPSRHGAVSLSQKAIPYYYDQDGPDPLYTRWDPSKTSRRRPHHNLSYRADEYDRTPPDFVLDPLRFDLEPNNFLRIEGHLGRNVDDALETLLALRESHRLPIDVIALRTGAFDENIDIDLSKEKCRFEDLAALYETVKSEIECFLVKHVKFVYELPDTPSEETTHLVPSLGLLANLAPEFRAAGGTIGAAIESILTRPANQPSVGFPPGPVTLAERSLDLVQAMTAFDAQITPEFQQLDLDALRVTHDQLQTTARQFEFDRRRAVAEGTSGFDAPGLADRLDDILYKCRLDQLEALVKEFERRVREVKQAQFLSHFLERHPGIQHKAGVPIGGTFILVYHELPKPSSPSTAPPPVPLLTAATFATSHEPDDTRTVKKQMRFEQSVARLAYKQSIAADEDVKHIYEFLTGNVLVPQATLSALARGVYGDTIAGLDDGTVIADFFLPYRVDCGCGGIQYTLPPSKLKVDVTTGCTREDAAEVTLDVEGAVGAISVRVDDDGTFKASTGTLRLDQGDHTIVVRDAAGNESATIEITVPPELQISDAESQFDDRTYQVTFLIEGGTPPYGADVGTVLDARYTSPELSVAEVLTVTVTDAAKCTVTAVFESGVKPCEFPCDGSATRFGYRLWVPEARPDFPINRYSAEVRRFAVFDPDHNEIDLTGEVQQIVNTPSTMSTANFTSVVERWLARITRLVADSFGAEGWFVLDHEPAVGTATNGAFFVDRLDCIDFEFVLAGEFVQGGTNHRFRYSYSPNGTEFSNVTDAPVRIPTFDGSESNRCRPDEPPVSRCEDVDLELVIHRDGAHPDDVVFEAEVTSGEGAAFLWEIQDGVPAIAGGDAVSVRFERAEPVDKLIRLTGFTERGCARTVERTINIVEPGG